MPLTPDQLITELDALTPAQRQALTPQQKKVLADVNGDGTVNVQDLLATINQYGLVQTPPDPMPVPPPAPPPVPPSNNGPTFNWTGAGGVQRQMNIAPPIGTATVTAAAGNGLDLSNRSDITVQNVDLGTLASGKDVIHCGNVPSSKRVLIRNVKGAGNNYGAFISGYASEWWLDSIHLTQQTGSKEHGLRSACADLLVTYSTIDTRNGGKSSLWYFGPMGVFDHCHFVGGHCWFGALDTDMAGTIISGVHVLCRNCYFEQTRVPMYEGITIRSGVAEIVFEDCTFKSASAVMAIDSRRTGNVILRRCKVGMLSANRPLALSDIGGDRSKVVIEG